MATKLSSGGFQIAIVTLDNTVNELITSIQQFKVTQTATFNNLKLRGMKLETSPYRFMYLLLLNTASSSDFTTHLIQVDTISQTVYLYEQTLPQFTPAASPHMFIPIAYMDLANYYIGLSSQGGIVNKNNLGLNIGLTSTTVSSLILTNIQKGTCQRIDKIDPTLSPIKDLILTSQYVITTIPSQNSGFGTLASFFQSTNLASYTNDNSIVSSFINIIDAMAIENVDAICQQIELSPLQNNLHILSGTISGVLRSFNLNLQFQTQHLNSCPPSSPTVHYSLVDTIDSSIGQVLINTNDISFSTSSSVSVTFKQDHSFLIKAYCSLTGQVNFQRVDIILSSPPFFTGYEIGSIIGNETINVLGKEIQLPQVNYSHDTYADLSITPPPSGLQVSAVKSKVDSTNSLLIILVQAVTPFQFQTYTVSLSLINGQGSFAQKYQISITLQDTAPSFTGFVEDSRIDYIQTNLNEISIFELPLVTNLENQIIKIEIIDKNSNQILPFVQLQSKNQIIISPTLKSQVGSYTLVIKLIDERGLFSTYFLNLQVIGKNFGPPCFSKPLEQSSLKCQIGKKYQIPLPDIIDPDLNDIDPEIKLDMPQQLSNIVKLQKLDSSNLNLNILVSNEKKNLILTEFQYKIKIIINDNNEFGAKESKYLLNLEFYDENDDQNITSVFAGILENLKQNKTQQNKPIGNQYIGGLKTIYKVSLRLLIIDRNGNAVIKLTSGGAPFGLQNIISQISNSTFKLRIVQISMLDIKYNITSKNNLQNTIDLKIDFQNKSLVSNGPQFDIIEIITENEISFQTNLFKIILEKRTRIQKGIPPQIDPKQQKFQYVFASYFQNGQIKVVNGFAQNIMIVILIQLVWSRINDLGFLIMNFMISMTVPGAVQILSSFIFNLIFMDILQTDYWLQRNIIKDDYNNDDSGLNNFFFDSGFQSMKVMQNLSSTLAYLFVFILIWLCIGILYLFQKIQKLKNLYDYLISLMKWKWTFLFMYSQLCPLLISSIINFYDLKFNNTIEIVQSIISILLPAIILFSLITQIIALKNARNLLDENFDSSEFKQKYQFLLEGQNIKNFVGKNWKIIEAIRWSLTIVILIVLREYYSFQITSLLMISVFVQALHIRYHPIEEKIEQRIILFNEVMTSFYLYLTLVLTDFNGENPLRDQIGFSILVLVLFTVGVNLIKTFYKGMKFIQLKIKRWIQRRNSAKKYVAAPDSSQKDQNKSHQNINNSQIGATTVDQTRNDESHNYIIDDDIIVEEIKEGEILNQNQLNQDYNSAYKNQPVAFQNKIHEYRNYQQEYSPSRLISKAYDLRNYQQDSKPNQQSRVIKLEDFNYPQFLNENYEKFERQHRPIQNYNENELGTIMSRIQQIDQNYDYKNYRMRKEQDYFR